MRSLERSRRRVEQPERISEQEQEQHQHHEQEQELQESQAGQLPLMANERKQSSPKVELTKLSHELIEECKRSQEDSLLSRHLRHELEKYVISKTNSH